FRGRSVFIASLRPSTFASSIWNLSLISCIDLTYIYIIPLTSSFYSTHSRAPGLLVHFLLTHALPVRSDHVLPKPDLHTASVPISPL
ncbi:uncharacterized protein SCHCODRAFT_02491848, partial [Schizophyllum commune H4-8]|uniref:uncharacterized protein n=1 Tax=Schizophyllum commune (strain H4-8 / FGSC 9210) TaxID=578458 RepID=UPI00215FDCC9